MKRMRVLFLIGMLTLLLSGCQSMNEMNKNEVADSQITDVSETDNVENDIAENEILESEIVKELSFDSFKNLEFYFASGAGGWRTTLTIFEDGSFVGQYSDSDMGARQYYLSNFSGQFTKPEKVNDYTYSMQISELTYAEEVGKEEQKDELLYIYDEAYGIAGAKEILVYLPGAPLAELPENYKNWVNDEVSMIGDNVTELPFYGLYNEAEECGFFSYDIVENLCKFIESQKKLAVWVEESLINDALNQSDMNDLAYQLYEIWDVTLNEEWSVLKQVLDADTMKELLEKQREWIAHKEQVIQELVDEVGGGSIASLLVNQRAATLTKFRVYELLDYVIYGDAATDKIYYSGQYADKQGTEEIYSNLYLEYVGEEEYEATISLYRLAELEGTVTVDNGTLGFWDEELKVEGTITIKDNTAVFMITESEFAAINKGDSFTFEKVY